MRSTLIDTPHANPDQEFRVKRFQGSFRELRIGSVYKDLQVGMGIKEKRDGVFLFAEHRNRFQKCRS